MSDPTTEGFEATPAEIEGMVRNLCAYALSEPDAIQRYVGLTHQQALFEGMVEAIRRERGRVIADLAVSGITVEDVAKQTGLGTVVKVRKLISFADQTKRVNEALMARKEADRKAATADKAAAKKAAKTEPQPAPEPLTPPAPLPQHLAAPSGKRLLTAADRAALGLPVVGASIGKRPPAPAERAAREPAAREQGTREPAAREPAAREPAAPAFDAEAAFAAAAPPAGKRRSAAAPAAAPMGSTHGVLIGKRRLTPTGLERLNAGGPAENESVGDFPVESGPAERVPRKRLRLRRAAKT